MFLDVAFSKVIDNFPRPWYPHEKGAKRLFIQYHSLDISFSLEGTRFRALNLAQEKQERIIPSHSHGEGSYEIHYNAAGRGQLLSGGQMWELEPGSLYLVGPHVAHAQIPDLADPQLDYCVYLQLSHPGRSESPLAKCFENQTFWVGKDTQNLPELFARLFDELAERRPGYTIWVKTLLTQLVVCMLRNYGQSLPADHFQPATPEEAQAFIIEEAFLYEYPTLTLEQLAERLSLSPRQTQRLLRGRYEKTFQQKRSEARMSAATILLTRTPRRISAISESLGYSAPEHFTAAFAKYFGMSASEYRRRYGVSAFPQESVLEPPEGLASANVPRKNRN